MTKKEQIVANALQLFANQGYNAISTRKIAEESSVSEALIFRHFKSKDGLLSEIMQGIDLQFEQYSSRQLEGKDYIQFIMELPFHLNEDELRFWKLLYRMKWEGDSNANAIFDKLKPALSQAFKQIGFANAHLEADLLLSYVHGFTTSLITDQSPQKELLLSTLQSKYGN